MAHSNLLLALIFQVLAIVVVAEKIQFTNYLTPGAQNCYVENIGDTVQGKYINCLVSSLSIFLAIIEANSDSSALVLSITDPKGKKIRIIEGQKQMRYNFAAFYSGNYQICIQSYEKNSEVKYNFLIETGVSATDYSNIVTKKHLRPVELQAQKIQDMIEQLRSELTMLIVSEESLKSEN